MTYAELQGLFFIHTSLTVESKNVSSRFLCEYFTSVGCSWLIARPEKARTFA